MELTLCFMGQYKIKEKIMKMTVELELLVPPINCFAKLDITVRHIASRRGQTPTFSRSKPNFSLNLQIRIEVSGSCHSPPPHFGSI